MRRLGLLMLFFLLAACQAKPPLQTLRPAPLEDALRNPERGFYRTGLDLFDPDNEAAIAELAASGVTLVYPYDTWLPRDRALSGDELEALKTSFQRLEKYGLKLILRFRYSEEGDAPFDVIETHLDQLLPIVRKNAYLVYVFQAGFLGRWGEWHCWRATGICHDDAPTKAWLLKRLTEELPEDLPIAIRYPVDKVKYRGFPTDRPPSEPLFGRIAHHNDCWLANATDMGTYPEEDPKAWRAFVYAENDRLPYGGETCAWNPPRTDGENALSEAERAHLDYLNAEYHEEVLKSWARSGALEEFARRLGYRIELVQARWPYGTKTGGLFPLSLALKNTGFSRLKRPRPAYLVFEKAGKRSLVRLGLELTALPPGKEKSYHFLAQAPNEPGLYRIGLAFPDPSPRLASNPRYALRLASAIPYDEGIHWLGTLEVR